MASIPVSSKLNALTNMVNQTASYARQEEAVQDSFDMVMSRINSQADAKANLPETGGTVGTAVKASAVADTRSMSAGITGADSAGQSAAKSNSTAERQTVESPKRTDDTSQASEGQDISDEEKGMVSKAGKDLVDDVAQEMDVTPEEVEEAMEVLGLTAVQLLDPANMKQLLMTLSGNEDQLSIVTDAELYGHLKNLLDTVSGVLEDLQTTLGLSEEELGALVADMAVLEKPAEGMDILEELPAQPEDETVNLEGMKDYAVTVRRDGETVEVKVTVDDASGSKSVQEEVTVAPVTEPKQEPKSGNRNSSGEHKGENNPSGNLMMQTPVEQPNLQEVSAGQPAAERFVSTEDIMNQIMEYMKINLRGDVQELELQLHPASLGNVHVQIASKDGMITAQFTAQNEVVKAAIESQLIQLRNQFEEQGLKVDAVEVAVANYQFGQNFSGDEEHPGERQESGKKSRRSINLNDVDLDDMSDELDDSEKIAAQMMAQNGNTVDYTV